MKKGDKIYYQSKEARIITLIGNDRVAIRLKSGEIKTTYLEYINSEPTIISESDMREIYISSVGNSSTAYTYIYNGITNDLKKGSINQLTIILKDEKVYFAGACMDYFSETKAIEKMLELKIIKE